MESIAKEKYKVIANTLKNDNNELNIKWLCDIAQVSRSGFYNWMNIQNNENEKENQDKKDFELILEAYNYRGINKGARTIKMKLERDGKIMNLKKIRRLMKKYNLQCPIRKANPMRRMAKAIKTNNYTDNLLNRNFKAHNPREVILTDITYMFYGKNNARAYLSVMKDAKTNEILSYVLSESLEMKFVEDTIKQLRKKHGKLIPKQTMIHSDQGCHYTSTTFRKMLKDNKWLQSMSRRGNCWDNAPQESFFGHMKDEINISTCKNINELQKVIDNYMDYYNNERYQWGLAKLAPSEFYKFLIANEYPQGYHESQNKPNAFL